MIISCNSFFNVCSQTSFYIFVNQIVCVDAKCICFTYSMLHLGVITSNVNLNATTDAESVEMAKLVADILAIYPIQRRCSGSVYAYTSKLQIIL